MTDTLISLISILVGIVGSNSIGYFYKKYSFGLVGNTISGVFGSVFFIKSFGRLGFDPKAILQLETMNYTLFTINSLVSFLGGALAVILLTKVKKRMNTSKE